jgi:FKBP-type peptidyl-prolyl cis-trans isomerase 2
MSDDKNDDWLNLKTFIILCVAVGLVVAGAAIGYGVLFDTQKGASTFAYTVKNGDQVTVDYVGMFEDGTVFDTSIENIANNNALYPKSLTYTPREDYLPLAFTVGLGEMIAGFDSGVVGMATNQTKTLTIPPEEGYGYPDESLIETMSMTVSKPIYEWTTNTTNFETKYFVPAELGTTARSAEYGWNITVNFIDPISDIVRIKNEPHLHEKTSLYLGWYSEVISIDTTANGGEGEIIVKHMLTPEDAGKLVSTDEAGRAFTVINVNTDSNIITIDYNTEVVGKTLIFKVTVVNINPTSENPV